MKATTGSSVEQEPIGIVISRGARTEQPPVVFAYVWGPAPDTGDELVESAA